MIRKGKIEYITNCLKSNIGTICCAILSVICTVLLLQWLKNYASTVWQLSLAFLSGFLLIFQGFRCLIKKKRSEYCVWAMAVGINMNAFFTLFIVCISNKGSEDITGLRYISIALFVSFCVLIAISMMFGNKKKSFRNDEISDNIT